MAADKQVCISEAFEMCCRRSSRGRPCQSRATITTITVTRVNTTLHGDHSVCKPNDYLKNIPRELIRDQRVCNGDLSFDGIDKLSKRMCFGVKSVLVSQYLLLELKGRNAPKKNNRNKDNPSSARHERVSLQVIHPNWLEIIGDSFM